MIQCFKKKSFSHKKSVLDQNFLMSLNINFVFTGKTLTVLKLKKLNDGSTQPNY